MCSAWQQQITKQVQEALESAFWTVSVTKTLTDQTDHHLRECVNQTEPS